MNQDAAGAGPEFTIIVPAYRRPKELARCLEALARQTYSKDLFTVLVVDDGTPEPLREVVERFREVLPIRCLRQSNQGPAAARNAALRLAARPWVAFTDDDCEPAPGWLEALARQAKLTPEAALGGPVVNGLGNNLFAQASQTLIDYLYEYHRASPRGPVFFTSNNLAFPLQAVDRPGAFDASFPLAAAEDRDFCDRWRQGGGAFAFAPEAVVHHFHDLRFWGFLRQHFHYGCGAWRFHRMRAERGDGPVRVEPGSFYLNLLLFPLRRKLRAALAQSALLLVSQAVNAAGFFWECGAAMVAENRAVRADAESR